MGGMPGNLVNLAVDHDLVTYLGETNTQNANAHVASTVTTALKVNQGDAMLVAYTRPSTVTYTGSDNGQITLPGTITFGSAVLMQGVTTAFHPNSRVRTECQTVTSGVADTWRNLGVYTVATGAANIPTDTVLKVQETIVANDCTAASSSIRITQVSNVVKSVEYHADVTGTGGTKGFIILEEEGADSYSADVASGAGHILKKSDGTRENVECSDRGLCQEDGTCKCFPGYTGDDCSIQKSISM